VSGRRLALFSLLAALGMAGVLSAQGGSRGGGGAGGGATRVGGAGSFVIPTRMVLLTSTFKLDKDQEQTVRNLIDEASKDPRVAATRTELASAHAAIGAAIQAGASPDEVDAAVKTYAAVSQDMASLELNALAKVVKSLHEPQRANAAAMTSAVALMRGAFLDKKWDVAPGAKNY
jgi:hypothetical protein